MEWLPVIGQKTWSNGGFLVSRLALVDPERQSSNA
jgi:hypothetical protein